MNIASVIFLDNTMYDMKAEIDENGCLKVEAEAPLECYALKRWVDENFANGDTSILRNIVFDWSYPKIEITYSHTTLSTNE